MVERTRRALLVAAALVLATGMVPADTPSAGAAATRPFVSGWWPYWMSSTDTGVLTGATSGPLMKDVSLFSAAGLNNTLANVKSAAMSAGLPVWLTWSSTEWSFFKPAAAEKTAQDIADTVVAGGYIGADIDFEFVFDSSTDGDNCCTKAQWPTIQADWIAFVKLLSGKLHNAVPAKKLSVTVPPVWNGGASGYTVYAQDQIHPYVDQLRLMVYDWAVGSPGAISPKWWVDQVMAYTQSLPNIKRSKLVLGLPAYGRHWKTKKNAGETCPSGALGGAVSVTMKSYRALATQHGVTPTRDATTGELTFAWDERVSGPLLAAPKYVPASPSATAIKGSAGRTQVAVRLRFTTCTVRHVVSVSDEVAVRNSANKAYKAGWSGISLWAFGYETAALYTELAKVPLP